MRRLFMTGIICIVLIFSINIRDASCLTLQEVKNRVLATLESVSEDAYKPGEVIVKFREGVVQAQAVQLHRSLGAQVVRQINGLGIELVRLPEGVSVKEAVQQYMADPSVEYAEPNYIYKIKDTFPNDTYFSQQWALHNTGQMLNAVPDADMDMPEAWDIATGSRDFIVAVIDTGVDYTHPDLALNIWINKNEVPDNGIDDDNNNYIDDIVGWDFVLDTNQPFDALYHGTHVAGIIGALGNNEMGITGVNWYVRIMPLKAGDENGLLYLDAILDAIHYAADMGADVINASYGGYAFSQSQYDAISYADSKGVLFVAAAGNETNDNDLNPVYPASYDLPNIISVAASDQDDQFATFSNYGATSVDVVAPGNHTLSTWPTYVQPLGYETIEGTSMASPHVAGLAALLMDYYRNFDIYQIKATIESFVDKLPQFNGYVASNGRVNAYKALSSLLVPSGLVSTASDSTAVKLTWQDNATGESGYRIERKAEGEASFQQIATVGADTTEYTDTNVEAGKTYTYRVIAYNSIGESPQYSNETTITVPTTTISSGGGGCAIVASDTHTALDIGLILGAVIALLWLRRQRH